MQKALTLVDTAIGKKAIVGLTGAILYGFVLVHMAGNCLIFLGQQALDDYGHLLHAIPELLWGARIVLLISLVTHIVLTLQIAGQARAARKVAYQHGTVEGGSAAKMNPIQAFARKVMPISGILIAIYVVFHLAHLTGGATLWGYLPAFQFGHVYENVVHGFRIPWVTFVYVFCNAMLCVHLFHGAQAFSQSLGLRHPKYNARLDASAAIFAGLIGLMNVAIPLLVLSGIIGAQVS